MWASASCGYAQSYQNQDAIRYEYSEDYKSYEDGFCSQVT